MNNSLLTFFLFFFFFLYIFTDTLNWSVPEVTGSKPMPRDGHSACVINDRMYIFGGYQTNPSQLSQDLYMLNLHSMVWHIIKTTVLYK